ncbi:MAG TPA: autotransporter-associated beta strand repeat-containing protein [Rhizomicrobium sp.]
MSSLKGSVSAATLGLFMTVSSGGAATAATDIESGHTYQASNLGANATFAGGTVDMDKSPNATDFTIGNSATNTFDAIGNSSILNGTLTSASNSTGTLIFTDSKGGGTITLTNSGNDYVGPTTIDSGVTLALSGTGTIASSTSVTDNGGLDISKTTSGASISSLSGTGTVNLGSQSLTLIGSSGIFSGVISGTGSVIVGSGTTVLSGDNTYTGGTSILTGRLQIGNGGTTGSIFGDISDAGTLAFDRTDTVTLGNLVHGSGGLTQAGSGTLSITAAETYTGVTTISVGTLALTGNGSIAASSSVAATGIFNIAAATSPVSIISLSGTGSVVLGSQSLTITNGATADSFTGAISGTGSVTVGAGTLTLGGTNTYTGGTSILSGATLQLGTGGSGGSIVGDIADAGTLVINRSDAFSYGGVVSGAGALTKTGAGTTTLTAAQTYTGLTTISNGTLALSGNGSIAASSGVVDNGTLDISASTNTDNAIETLSGSGKVVLGTQTLDVIDASSTFAGIISGTGNVVLEKGTETLSNDNTFTGTTTISGGTLAITGTGAVAASSVIDNSVFDISGTTAGTSIQSLAGNGSVLLGSQTLTLLNATGTFSGTLMGAGGLTVKNGTETLTSAIGYTGATTVASGATLVLQGDASSAASSLEINGTLDATGTTGTSVSATSLGGSGTVNLGTNGLVLTNANDIFSGTLATSGGLMITGGTETITSDLNYTGGTTIATNGTLQLGFETTAGSIAGDVTDNGTLAFDRSDSLIFNGIISGTGKLVQSGPGITILTGNETYTGGTTISAGTLQIGNGSASGQIIGNVVDNGTLAFDRNDAVTYGSVISGSGGVSQMGSGSLTLTAANTYTGATAITAGGSLILTGNGSIAGTSNVADDGTWDISATSGNSVSVGSLSGAGTVTLGAQSLSLTKGAGTFSGAISGTGSLFVTGGDEVLAGTNTYTGATTVGGGTLEVDGSIASSSSVIVNSGGTLAGSGKVSQTTINSGGTLAGGSAGSGTLTINGNLTENSGAKTLVNISSASASMVQVNGKADISGTLTVANLAGVVPVGKTWTILSATGGVEGTYALVQPTGSNFSYKLSYDADDVFLMIALARLTPLLPTSATVNEKAVTGGIDAAIANGDNLPTAFDALGNLSSSALASAADQMSGELGADLPQIGQAMSDPFMGAMFDRMNTFDGGHSASTIPARGPGGWISVLGDTGDTDGELSTLGAHHVNANAIGVVGGYDWLVGPNLLVGLAASGGSAHFSLSGDLGKGHGNAYQLGGYGYMHFSPHIYGSLAGMIAVDDISTNRTVTVSGTDDLNGKATGFTYGARYETGLYFGWLTPYAAVQSVFFNSPGFSESASSGASTFALSYDSRTTDNTRVEVGAGESGDIAIGSDTSLNLSGRLAYMHEFESTRDIQASFAALPNSDFTVFGAQPSRDAALVSFGARVGGDTGLAFQTKLNGELGDKSKSYFGTLGVDYRW